MKKIVSLLLVLVVVLGCVGLAACGGAGGGAVVDDGGSPPADGNGGGNGDGNGDGNGGGNGGGESLTDIVGQVGGIDSVSYTMEASGPGMPLITTKIWMEGNKFRSESGDQETMIFIVDYDIGKAYMYMPDLNMAYEVDISTVSPPDYEYVQDIPGYNPTIIGTATMDGKECLVVEYSQGGATVKIWIWKQHGFPVRTETTTAEGTMVVEFKDIDFSDIPDSMFEVDPGVTIMEI